MLAKQISILPHLTARFMQSIWNSIFSGLPVLSYLPGRLPEKQDSGAFLRFFWRNRINNRFLARLLRYGTLDKTNLQRQFGSICCRALDLIHAVFVFVSVFRYVTSGLVDVTAITHIAWCVGYRPLVSSRLTDLVSNRTVSVCILRPSLPLCKIYPLYTLSGCYSYHSQ